MKKILLFSLLLRLSFGVNAQFSETFFNSLIKNNNPVKILTQLDAIQVNGGYLGVLLADSASTNIQFVKMEFNGRFYNTYSSTIPAEFETKNTSIIGVYEQNTNVFVTVSDQITGKLAVLHYNNYAFVDYVKVDVPLINAHFESSFDASSNSIAIYAVNQSYELKRYLFDLTTMATPSELLIEDGFSSADFQVNFTSTIYQHSFFTSKTTNEHVYYCKGGKLHQVEIGVSNSLLSLDTLITCGLIYGVYEENGDNYITVLDTLLLSVSRYKLTGNSIVLPSINHYTMSSFEKNTTLYDHSNGKDYWLRISPINNYYLESRDNTGLILDSIYKNEPHHIREFKYEFGNYFGVGVNYRTYEYRDTLENAFFMSWDSKDKLFDFKEKSGKYQMGRFNVASSYGTSLLLDLEDALLTGSLIVDSLGRSTDFSSSYLIAGKDENGNFRGGNISEYRSWLRPGPYTTLSDYSQEDLHKYYESFYVDVYQIAEHIQQASNSNYIPPKGILYWPGNGDVSRGQSAQLAPYVDLNGNGIYEPLLGEYPDFVGTRCLLTVSHDPLTNDGYLNTGLEFFSYMYMFDCEDTAIKNTIFTKLVINNRGGVTYDSLIVGMFNDFDIGAPNDDYCGSNVDLGIGYQYNADSQDDSYNSSIGFDSTIPAQGFAILKGSKLDNDGIDNAIGVGVNESVNGYGFSDGIIDNEHWGMESASPVVRSDVGGAIPGVNDDPSGVRETFLYMTSRWGDSTHFTCGSIGATPSAIPCKYIFPGNSDPLNYGTYGVGSCGVWSEVTAVDPQGDRRNISATNRYQLLPDSTITFDGAFILGDGGATVQNGVDNLFHNTQLIRQYFQANQTPCGQTFGNNGNIASFLSIPEEKIETYTLYPNPTNGMVMIKGLKGDEQVRVLDFSGRNIANKVNANQIDLSALSEGVYFVIITGSEGAESFKVIKN